MLKDGEDSGNPWLKILKKKLGRIHFFLESDHSCHATRLFKVFFAQVY